MRSWGRGVGGATTPGPTGVSPVKRLIDVPPPNIWNVWSLVGTIFSSGWIHEISLSLRWSLISWLESHLWATSNKQTTNHRHAALWLVDQRRVNSSTWKRRQRFYLCFRRKRSDLIWQLWIFASRRHLVVVRGTAALLENSDWFMRLFFFLSRRLKVEKGPKSFKLPPFYYCSVSLLFIFIDLLIGVTMSSDQHGWFFM